MKKTLSYLLVLIMMLSLAACGSKSESESSKETNKVKEEKVDAYEVLEKAGENFDAIKSVEAEIELDATGETEEEGKQTVKGTVSLQIDNLLKDGMVVAMPINATIPDSEPIEGALYWADGYGYVDLMGSQMKLELPIDELTGLLETETSEDTSEEATDETTDEMTEEDKEKFEKCVKIEAKKDGDKYVVTLDMDWDEMLKVMEEEVVDYEDLEMMKSLNYEECTISLIVDKDYFLEEASLSMMLNGEVEGISITANVSATIKLSTDNITIDLPDFSSYYDMSSMMEGMEGMEDMEEYEEYEEY